jgi:hypothetical protein
LNLKTAVACREIINSSGKHKGIHRVRQLRCS